MRNVVSYIIARTSYLQAHDDGVCFSNRPTHTELNFIVLADCNIKV
jgi:hypothetical protein